MRKILLLLALVWAGAASAQDTPRQLSYPYEWDDATCQTDFHAFASWFGGWRFDGQTKAFYQSGKGTNWIGSLTTDQFLFPEGEHVSCHFDYATAGGAVTLRVLVDYGNNTADTIVKVLPESTQDFARDQFAFTAKGPAIVYISASLANPLDYGSFLIRRICFAPAQPDLVAAELLAPAAGQVAVGRQTVSVRYRNMSPFVIERPTLGYDAGQGRVEETYEGTIAPDATLDYTFRTTYVHEQEGEAVLRAWCQAEGDGDTANDTLARTIIYYMPQTFPFQTAFDGDNSRWSVLGGTWQFGNLGDGNAVACCTAGGTLLSPAVHLQEGTARVSFYYAAVNRSGARLRLLMGRGTGADELTEVLFDEPVSNGGWLNGYHLLNITEEGNYYFALQYADCNDQLFIDNFKVDAEEDLCMQSVTFDQQSGFGLTDARVTLTFSNHGVSPQTGITVRYYLNDQQHYVDETVTETVLPGQTCAHTFAAPVDISATDSTYTLYGELLTVVGQDTQNDLIQGQQLTNYAPFATPYACNFMDDTRYAHWLAPASPTGNQWYIANNFYAYDGNIDLLHQNEPAAGHGQSDDWAYSEALRLEPGEYEVAFFHRGRTFFDGPDYEQSFEACLGTARTPEAMTTTLVRLEDHDYRGTMNYERSVSRVTIADGGLYYLGFHNFSQPNRGETHIDGINVTAVTPGLPLPYLCDFATDPADGWTRYNEHSANAFPKWQLEDGAMQLTMDGGYAEGPLVSPCLQVEPGRTVMVTVDYDLTSDADTTALCVYVAPLNTPQAFSLVATAPQSDHHVACQYTVPADASGDLYIALRTNDDLRAPDRLDARFTLAIRSVSVAYDVTESIAPITARTAAEAIYTLSGQRLAGPARKGVYIQDGKKVVVR